jgi:hypothetical protein
MNFYTTKDLEKYTGKNSDYLGQVLRKGVKGLTAQKLGKGKRSEYILFQQDALKIVKSYSEEGYKQFIEDIKLHS